MNVLRWTKSIGFALVLLSGFISPGSLAVPPMGKFACQVIVEGGQFGVVFVEAHTKAAAERAVPGAKAYTTDKILSPTTEVVQCINRLEERFSDYQFQQFYENVPR